MHLDVSFVLLIALSIEIKFVSFVSVGNYRAHHKLAMCSTNYDYTICKYDEYYLMHSILTFLIYLVRIFTTFFVVNREHFDKRISYRLSISRYEF